jgi:immunomodulating metalloprotease
MKNFHPPLLGTFAISLLLSACGAGGDSPAATSATNASNVAEVADVRSAGTVAAPEDGTQTSNFAPVTVAPEGSASTPSTSGIDNPVPKDALALALASGNSSGVTADRILVALRAEVDKQIAVEKSLIQSTFGINADGSSTLATAANINWEPGQDSMYFAPTFNGRTNAILQSNWKFESNVASANRVLAAAGEFSMSQARYAAFGNNPMAVRGDAGMDQFTKNTVNWLLKRPASSAPLRVVVAHLPGTATTWFKHEVPTRQWMAAQFPGVTINGKAVTEANAATTVSDDSCDGTKLADCLQGADLLIMGRQQGPNGGTSAITNSYPTTYNGDTILNAVKAAQTRGMPVMYLHHDGDNNDLSTKMFQYFGMNGSDNYFSKEGVKGLTVQTVAPSATTLALSSLVNRFDQGAFSSTFSGCAPTVAGPSNCDNDAAYMSEFETPVEAIKSKLRGFDTNAFALFAQNDYMIEKLQVLLGDKWRQTVAYPLTKETSGKNFYKSLFSDAVVYINRSYSAKASVLGTFAPKEIAANTQTLNRTITTVSPQVGKKEYVTGLYVMPGKTVTLERTDTGTNVVKFGLNLLRDTTRVFDKYDRPSGIASPRIELKAAKPITITSPYGGPIYLFIDSEANASTVSVTIDGVITHPVLRDANDPIQVEAFRSELATTQTNWVVIGTEFLTVHSNLGHFNTTLANYNGNLTALAVDINNYIVKDTYELAGFNAATPGKFNLAPSVLAFCNAAGWDCTGIQHRREVMQHVIVDTVALCGSACSGNPYDQSGPLKPSGWGETHEIGHNLQRDRLKIYDGKSGEVSNNIFPTHKQMAINKATSPNPFLVRSNTSAKLGFTAIVESMNAEASKPGAGFDSAYAQMWSSSAYAANNGQRLGFYRQLVEFARVHRANTSNGTNFTDGWELYTLLYLMERNFTASAANWSAVAPGMGFGTYATYPSAITGNDFMLIGASRIIGVDMRPVFDMWGVSYKKEASEQVTALGLQPAAKWLFPMNNVNAFGAAVGTPILMTPSSVYPAAFN